MGGESRLARRASSDGRIVIALALFTATMRHGVPPSRHNFILIHIVTYSLLISPAAPHSSITLIAHNRFTFHSACILVGRSRS